MARFKRDKRNADTGEHANDLVEELKRLCHGHSVGDFVFKHQPARSGINDGGPYFTQ